MASLRELDRVDWKALKHCYGSAADVPTMIRALKSRDEESRMDAINKLWSSIWHQGTVYEATAHAVPFLVELLTDKSVRNKAEIIKLLELIATGETHGDAQWESSAREAVFAGKDVYLSFLKNKDQEIKTNIAELLACLPPDETIKTALIEAIDTNKDDATRAHFINLLGTVGRGDAVCVELYKKQINRTDSHLSRLAAAGALSVWAPGQSDDGVKEVVMEMLTHPSPKFVGSAPESAEFRRVSKTICRSLPADLAREVVSSVLGQIEMDKPGQSIFMIRPLICFAPSCANNDEPSALSDLIVDRLLPMFAETNPIDSLELARVLVHFTFASRQCPSAKDMNPRQRAVLSKIVESENLWMLDKKLAQLLQQFDLPADRTALQKLI